MTTKSSACQPFPWDVHIHILASVVLHRQLYQTPQPTTQQQTHFTANTMPPPKPLMSQNCYY